MNDAILPWGGDLVAGPTGDIATVSGSELGQQRVLRRLLTNSNDYIWHSAYGAGLGQFVGATTNSRQIVGIVKSQIFQEGAVARQPDPSVSLESFTNGSVSIAVSYVDALTGNGQSLTFSVSN